MPRRACYPERVTRVLTVDPVRPDPAILAEAARVLREGGLVAFPTETVYGLGARGLDSKAVAKIFAAKGRPTTHPLILHVEGEAQAEAVSGEWSARASLLARAFWPGPLTLVVPRAAHVPAAVAGGEGAPSIAVRAPAHPVARALLAAFGEPVAAPSANRYQSLSPTTAEHVRKSLGDAVDLILDGGACAAGIESTVVDVRGASARVLRPGALDVASLRAVLPELVLPSSPSPLAEGASRPSPGMDPRHYAPHAPLVVVEGRAEALRLATLHARSERVGLVVRGPLGATHASIDVRILPGTPAGYAHALFATLHALDDAGVTRIVVEAVPPGDAWWAVADRLRRGSS